MAPGRRLGLDGSGVLHRAGAGHPEERRGAGIPAGLLLGVFWLLVLLGVDRHWEALRDRPDGHDFRRKRERGARVERWDVPVADQGCSHNRAVYNHFNQLLGEGRWSASCEYFSGLQAARYIVHCCHRHRSRHCEIGTELAAI